MWGSNTDWATDQQAKAIGRGERSAETIYSNVARYLSTAGENAIPLNLDTGFEALRRLERLGQG